MEKGEKIILDDDLKMMGEGKNCTEEVIKK